MVSWVCFVIISGGIQQSLRFVSSWFHEANPYFVQCDCCTTCCLTRLSFFLCPSLYILSLISKGTPNVCNKNVQNLSLELTHAYLTLAILISIGVLPERMQQVEKMKVECNCSSSLYEEKMPAPRQKVITSLFPFM